MRADAALREADEVDARTDRAELPMAGVPVAIKDNVAVAGEPMRLGSACTPDTPQPRDHEIVRRLRAAGAVVVGITRVPELCVFGTTDSTFGITRNPWNLALTPGGSSGGSAAAVAAAPYLDARLLPGRSQLARRTCRHAGIGRLALRAGLPRDKGRRSWQERAERFFDSHDVLITPAALAPRPGRSGGLGVAELVRQRLVQQPVRAVRGAVEPRRVAAMSVGGLAVSFFVAES